jgi:flagellar motor protein MotB
MKLTTRLRIAIGAAILAALAACTHGAQQAPPVYIVFFPKGSAEPAPESRSAIEQAAAAIRKTRPSAVALASGVAAGDNLRLAEPRFEAIRQALIAKGVPPNVIARSSLPDATLNAGPTGDTRVEILLLAKPPS